MKITRQRLKQIILEEMGDGDVSYTSSSSPGDYEDSHGYAGDNMSTIGESAGWDIAQQLASVMVDSGIGGSDNPQELATALMGLGKLGVHLLGATVAGTAAANAFAAFEKLFSGSEEESAEEGEPEVYEQREDTAEKPSQAGSREEDNTLGELIQQAIAEELNLLRTEKL